jgi:DNA-directed RNA polymerase subunit M/transcription elongation factor TFIIS
MNSPTDGTIKTRCLKCDSTLRVRSAVIGKKVKCPKCDQAFIVAEIKDNGVVPENRSSATKKSQQIPNDARKNNSKNKPQPEFSETIEHETPPPLNSRPAPPALQKLLNCEDCASQVSRRASTCPHCGAPLRGLDQQQVGESPSQLKSNNLATCEDCGRQVSANAVVCPHCAAPRQPIIDKSLKTRNASIASFFGILLLLYCIPVLIAALNAETSVSSGGGERVHNIGLMQKQQITVFLCVVGIVSGAVLLVVDSKRARITASHSQTKPRSLLRFVATSAVAGFIAFIVLAIIIEILKYLGVIRRV